MKPLGLNEKVIKQWKKDLLDQNCPKLNIDYPILERDGQPGDAKRFEGDPGFILAWHFAIEGGDVEDDTQLSEWMSYRTTEDIIFRYTGIPIDVAKQLVEPAALWRVNYPTRSITPKQFISVLDSYLETGLVLWEKVLLDNPTFNVAEDDLPVGQP